MTKMPHKDPNNWNHLLLVVLALWDSLPDWARLLIFSIPMTFIRAIHSHKRPWKDAVLETLWGTFLIVVVAYGVKHAGASEWVTIMTIGALFGFGFNVTLDMAKDAVGRVMDKFLPKK